MNTGVVRVMEFIAEQCQKPEGRSNLGTREKETKKLRGQHAAAAWWHIGRIAERGFPVYSPYVHVKYNKYYSTCSMLFLADDDYGYGSTCTCR